MLRRFLFAVSLTVFPLLLLPCQARAGPQTPPSNAESYPAVAIHPEEHVAVAADPCNTKNKTAIFRLDYLQYGFMPIRIIVTNHSEHPISLADAHIDFVTAAGDKIPAAAASDIERRADRVKRPDSGYKLPGPLPRIGNKSGKNSKKIEDDFRAFEFSTVSVAPHSTSAGFLFYDLDGIANPLVGAQLSVTTLRDATGKELFSFEVPLDQYLARTATRRKH